MIVTIESAVVCGMNCIPVRVEVDAAKGFPCFEMVGYLGSEVREAKERVRVALKNMGINLPPVHITVNLAPAHVHKAGTGFDLPVAVGVLAALEYLPTEHVQNILMAGEIGLGGEVRPVRGILPMVQKAKEMGITHCIVPKANEKEGGVIQGVKVTGVQDLKQVYEYLSLPPDKREEYLPCANVSLKELSANETESSEDLADIAGQEAAKRGVEIAAAGFHPILMIGPPGAGKSMLAKRIPGILPPLSLKESLEVSSVYSVAGLLNEKEALITKRPFISPHHTISEQALIGGGQIPRPGAVSLAHHAVLFLDELGEFKRKTLDILRQPLEEKEVHIARAVGNYTYPADFLLAAAMNPCPCGYYPDRKKCRCSTVEINRYLSKISGPILDRIDLCVEVSAVSAEDLNSQEKRETSKDVRKRILCARQRQKERFEGTTYSFNSQIAGADVKKMCPLGAKEQKLLNQAFQTMGLSARAYHRVIKVARTIADLEGSEKIRDIHLTEALCYRMADGKYWAERE